MAKTEYEPGTMIAIIEDLLDLSPVSVEPSQLRVPEEHEILSVYPNPFNPETRVRLSVLEAGRVSLALYDIRGRNRQQVLQDHLLLEGGYEFSLNTENVESGVYLLVLETPINRHIQKIVKLR